MSLKGPCVYCQCLTSLGVVSFTANTKQLIYGNVSILVVVRVVEHETSISAAGQLDPVTKTRICPSIDIVSVSLFRTKENINANRRGTPGAYGDLSIDTLIGSMNISRSVRHSSVGDVTVLYIFFAERNALW